MTNSIRVASERIKLTGYYTLNLLTKTENGKYINRLPSSSGAYGLNLGSVTRPQANKINRLHDKYEALSKQAIQLQKDLEKGITALGTYKRFAEAFPESKKYIPIAGKPTVPMVNLQDIRNRLDLKPLATAQA